MSTNINGFDELIDSLKSLERMSIILKVPTQSALISCLQNFYGKAY